jgi:hypothetical protein
MSKALEAKVRAVNKANAYAQDLWPKLRDYFAPYVGQKILKANGDLLAKVVAGMPDFPKADNVQLVYKMSSRYSLGWVVKVCESSPSLHPAARPTDSIAHYWESSIYVGDIEGDRLVKLYGHPPYGRTDWTADEVAKAREEYKLAEALAREAKDKFHIFGDYDR